MATPFFANRAQIVQTAATLCACLVGLYVAWPVLERDGVLSREAVILGGIFLITGIFLYRGPIERVTVHTDGTVIPQKSGSWKFFLGLGIGVLGGLAVAVMFLSAGGQVIIANNVLGSGFKISVPEPPLWRWDTFLVVAPSGKVVLGWPTSAGYNTPPSSQGYNSLPSSLTAPGSPSFKSFNDTAPTQGGGRSVTDIFGNRESQESLEARPNLYSNNGSPDIQGGSTPPPSGGGEFSPPSGGTLPSGVSGFGAPSGTFGLRESQTDRGVPAPAGSLGILSPGGMQGAPPVGGTQGVPPSQNAGQQ